MDTKTAKKRVVFSLCDGIDQKSTFTMGSFEEHNIYLPMALDVKLKNK